MENPFHLVAISGSLRAGSTNTLLIHAARRIAPPDMTWTLYDGLDDLPHFSPERDQEDVLPAPVRRLRDLLGVADGVLISTPEYAHGLPGSLKNALDWMVSSGEFDGKPTLAISASPSERGGDRALASLVQTLMVLGARIAPGGAIAVPFVRAKLGLTDDTPQLDPALAQALHDALDALVGTYHTA